LLISDLTKKTVVNNPLEYNADSVFFHLISSITGMSSTLPHYQGPASLPSDYALLSRYAGNQEELGDRIESDDELIDAENIRHDHRPNSTSILRRASAPAPPRLRPKNSITPMTSHPHRLSHIPMPGPIPSESTALLNPPVPRIDESIERTSDNGSKMLIFWEELRILTRYALPVFA
jgi:multidrug resistance protein, MATE family